MQHVTRTLSTPLLSIVFSLLTQLLTAQPTASIVPFTAEPLRLYAPTMQVILDGSMVSNVFMHTGSGDPANGMYGFTRVASDGKPRFHEGIDIAPLKRDKRGAALDDVRASADGEVAYINAVPGRSNYGRYIVLTHLVPLPRTTNAAPAAAAQTRIYTLYAHLASVAPELKAGQSILRGTFLGRLGNTPDIPVARAHLHFECGLIYNTAFQAWFHMDQARAQATLQAAAKGRPKPKAASVAPPDHGHWNGQNLAGVNPCDLFAMRDDESRIDIFRHISGLPIAFSLACEIQQIPSYFRLYPNLWKGAPFRAGIIRLDVDETGLVLRGSNSDIEAIPSPSVSDKLPKAYSHWRAGVLSVSDNLPGVTARRLIAPSSDRWQLTASGRDWLEIFLFAAPRTESTR